MRPPVERYVRCVSEHGGVELILGVQYDNAVEFMSLLSVSKQLLRDVFDSMSGSHAVTNPALLAEQVEREVVKQWPERYWFLEVCAGQDRDGWCQIYSPAPSPHGNTLMSHERRLRAVEAEVIEPSKTVDGDDAPWARPDSLRRRMDRLEVQLSQLREAGVIEAESLMLLAGRVDRLEHPPNANEACEHRWEVHSRTGLSFCAKGCGL